MSSPLDESRDALWTCGFCRKRLPEDARHTCRTPAADEGLPGSAHALLWHTWANADTAAPDGSNRVHVDAQDNALTIGVYDIGISKAVVFDGGAFSNPQDARDYARDLIALADFMESLDA